MLGKTEGKRRRKKQRVGWLDSLNEKMDMSLSKLLETVKDRGVWHTTVHGAATEHDNKKRKKLIADLQVFTCL